MVTAIIAAAGSGSRSGLNTNKVFYLMADGKTVLEHALIPFELDDRVTEIIIAVSEEDRAKTEEILTDFSTRHVVTSGGKTRSSTVRIALGEATNDIVLIHDGARPFLTEKLVYKCINDVLTYGSSVLAVPCTDTIAETDGEEIEYTERKRKYNVQTPQGFLKSDLERAFDLAGDELSFTDEAGLYCKFIGKAHLTEGSRSNTKLTYPEDFTAIKPKKVGIGMDIHNLAENRKLIIGGVTVPYEKGLIGHSDADVLLHAVCDAMLSAAGLRDIGYYFSDKDPEYKDISSMILLERVRKMVSEEGYKVHNVAIVIVAEQPKLNPYVERMKANISDVLRISPKSIGITCKTAEGTGAIGNKEAILTEAICSLTPLGC